MKLDIENNIVIKVLKSSFLARNDRKYLYSAVCIDTLKEKWYTDNDISEFLTILYQLPKESNVIRQAAYIQNTLWLYQPTEKVRQGRKEKEMKCREEYWIDYKEVKPKQWFFARLFNNK